jgi:hypothetical protein
MCYEEQYMSERYLQNKTVKNIVNIKYFHRYFFMFDRAENLSVLKRQWIMMTLPIPVKPTKETDVMATAVPL